jgi:hypothetical protein
MYSVIHGGRDAGVPFPYLIQMFVSGSLKISYREL